MNMSIQVTDTPQTEVSRDAFLLISQLQADYEKRQTTDSKALPLIDLSIGNPDLPPDQYWRDRLNYYIQEDDQHGYGDFRPDINNHLKKRFADYYQRRFYPQLDKPLLDPAAHVLDLAGTKEGIFYSLFALLKPGDSILMPNPCYTVYQSCAKLVGAKIELFDCDAEGQPDLGTITEKQLSSAKLLVLCTPNNPTGAALTDRTLDDVIQFAEQHDLQVIIDRAYAEIAFDAQLENSVPAGSALGRAGAMERVIELHSLSKSCNLAGWRIGFVAGSERLVALLKKIKFNTSFGVFLPIQQVAAEMLEHMEEIAAGNSQVYAERMTAFVGGLNKLGWAVQPSRGTFFLWAQLPAGYQGHCDLAFVEKLLQETGILVSPGSGFGSAGRGYVRIALVHDRAILMEALQRLEEWFSSSE